MESVCTLQFCGSSFVKRYETHELKYDENGQYVGQWQDNYIDDMSPILWIPAEYVDGAPSINGHPVEPLSDDDMRVARS